MLHPLYFWIIEHACNRPPDDAAAPPAGAGTGDERHPVRADEHEEGGAEPPSGRGRQAGGVPGGARLHPSHQAEDQLDELILSHHPRC